MRGSVPASRRRMLGMCLYSMSDRREQCADANGHGCPKRGRRDDQNAAPRCGVPTTDIRDTYPRRDDESSANQREKSESERRQAKHCAERARHTAAAAEAREYRPDVSNHRRTCPTAATPLSWNTKRPITPGMTALPMSPDHDDGRRNFPAVRRTFVVPVLPLPIHGCPGPARGNRRPDQMGWSPAGSR